MRSLTAGLLFASVWASVMLVGARTRGDGPPCDAVEVEYALDGDLRLSDTPLGKGDGTYRVGPGKALVRFEMRNGVPTGEAELLHYQMNERFRIDSHELFWQTHVASDVETTVGQDPCGVVAHGTLAGRRLDWTGDIRGARTDGHVSCDGSFCGSHGAPPRGTSELHVPPHPVHFAPWSFSPDLSRFTMPSVWTAHSDVPRQTAFVALTGREVHRRCAPTPRCPR